MKKIFFCISIVAVMVTHAQVTLQPEVPLTGLIQNNQLWKIMVVNSSTVTYNCRVTLVLTDKTTGLEIFTASTASFMLPAGVKQLNVNTLSPVQYNFLMPANNNSIQTVLPAGSYNGCYSVTSIALKEEIIAEECVQFESEPLSPPMLIFPLDSSLLEKAPVQFSWVQPMPTQMFSRLQYDVLITEVQEGQKADEAIQQNLPFYTQSNILTNTLSYPSSASTFDKNKWYAWQVVARDDRSYASKTETWVFRVVGDSVKKAIVNTPFVKVSMQQQEIALVRNGLLKLEYYNFLSDSIVKISIRKAGADEALHKFTLKVASGQNFMQYDLGKKMRLNKDAYYDLVLTNSAGEQYFLKFKEENK